MTNWNQLANKPTVDKTIKALKANGIDAISVESKAVAKKKVLDLIPKDAEVMTMSSVTLDTIGITDAINNSGNYDAVKPRLMAMNRETQGEEMNKFGAAPEYTVGSVHAVTTDGHVLIASNTGSQLPAYAYGAQKLVWVVGAQKIVRDVDEGMKRIYDYVLPLESERIRKVYGIPGSNVSKLLIVNKEVVANRITIVFVNEKLGF